MIETAQAFGVDIGGSGIKAAPVDLTKGDFAEPRLKILTPEVSTPQAVAKIVKQQLDHFEVPESAPVGIAFPAPIKPGQKLDFMANLDQSWIGVDVTEVFSEACGRPVVVVNDADAAGLAEVQFGAAKGQMVWSSPPHWHRHRHRLDLQRRAHPEHRTRTHHPERQASGRREVCLLRDSRE